MQRTLFVVTLLALLLTACGAPAAPTIDAAQVQASAVAAAGTIVAATQAAMPTNTPIPPTPLPSATPLPSITPAVLTGLGSFASPTTASSSANSSDCNHLLDAGASGPSAPVLIRNNTKGQVNFSIGLSSKNSYGQCGYLGWAIPKGQSITVSVPLTRVNQGDPCYWAYAAVNDPKKPTQVSGNQAYCINNGDKWTFDIGYDRIKLTPP